MPVAELGPEYSLAKRISTLEGLVRGLSTRDVLQNASIGAGGLTITDGGFLIVDGDATFNGSLTVPSGSLNTGGNLTVGGGITAGTSVVAGTSLNGATLAISGNGSVNGSLGTTTLSATQVNASGGINSVGVYNTDVSLLPGPRQPVWQNNNGTLGFAPSTWAKKTNVGPVQFTAADVLAVWPIVYQYIGQIAIRDDPENENYDPDYLVPWDVGFVAEQLVARNLSDFVVFGPDGSTPVTIDYAGFAAVAHQVVLQDHEARMQAAGI